MTAAGRNVSTLPSNDAYPEKASPRYFYNWEYYLIYMTFYLGGASNVAPWLSFILCIDYFQEEYPHGLVSFLFPIVNMSVLFLVTVFMLFAGRAIPIHGRVISGLGLQLVCLLFTPFISSLQLSPSWAYATTLMTLVGCSVSSAVVQSSLYGLGAIFGGTFLQALEGGKGASGVILVLIRCYTKWKIERHDAVIYFFATSSTLTFAALVLYLCLQHMPSAQVKLHAHDADHADVKAHEEHLGLLPLDHHECEKIPITVTDVWTSVSKQAAVAFLTFSICLACFPGLTTSAKSTTYHLGDWMDVVLVAAYNIGDLVGKSLPASVELLTVKTLHRPLGFQLAFIPLFVLDLEYPVHDLVTMGLVLALGCTTGYIGTSAMMLAPSTCGEREREMAGIICSLALILGLATGSYAGLAIECMMGSSSTPTK